ncbi:MAG: Gfo/Idh/MocA family oxidoreductase [Saprospiraceae bacterium]|nr:Gfo/Idh/MocA family oxidoreductase [Saprospiraceae bacterium]
MKWLALFCFTLCMQSMAHSQTEKVPLRIGVVGLTHTHVHWILGREKIGDIEIVGVAEPNRDLAKRYMDQHGFSLDLVFDSLEEMIETVKPDAVTAFGTIYDHLKVVEVCAPKGIHVMVEKPLAVSFEHAKKMAALAKKHGIQLLTNYETTWYPTNHEAFRLLHTDSIGALRKVVVHDGHQGPKEIGVNDEFLEWLTDPELNGAGALTDFGCYGANLITWLAKGQRPISVFAITQQIKPDIYPNVDDEATIILEYPTFQGIIQASWNWPVSRKDMEVYGEKGYAIAKNGKDLIFRKNEKSKEELVEMQSREYPLNDPFALLATVIQSGMELPPYDLNSLENNLLVNEILSAALESAKTGKKIYLDR